jgi:hypothetical protein
MRTWVVVRLADMSISLYVVLDILQSKIRSTIVLRKAYWLCSLAYSTVALTREILADTTALCCSSGD